MVLSGSTTDCLVGGEVGVGEGRKAGTAGGAAKDGAEILAPEVLAPAGALAGKLENPPCKVELTDNSDSCKEKNIHHASYCE